MRTLLLTLAILAACDDKDADDTAAGDTTSGDTAEETRDDAIGDPPAEGALVAVMTTNGETTTLVCDGDVFILYDGFWLFNSLLNSETCTAGADTYLLAFRNIPDTSHDAWPTGNVDIEVEVGGIQNRVYGWEADTWRFSIEQYDAASGTIVGTGQLRWSNGDALDAWFNATP